MDVGKEKAMATHSSTLAWKIPWTEEPGRVQSMGSLRVGTTEQLHFHFSLSCIGEGNGNPLQCSCLETPRDRGAWWAAVYGVAQSQTRLKRLSSSSSKDKIMNTNLWIKVLALLKSIDTWRQKEKGAAEEGVVEWRHWFNGHEFDKLWKRVKGRGAWRLQSLGSQSWTQLSNWTTASTSLY